MTDWAGIAEDLRHAATLVEEVKWQLPNDEQERKTRLRMIHDELEIEAERAKEKVRP